MPPQHRNLPSPPSPHRRVRPEEITLTRAERQRAAATRRRRPVNVAYVRARLGTPPPATSTRPHATPRIALLVLLVVLLVLVLLPPLRRVFLVAFSKPTVVTISLLPAATSETPILNQVLPIAQFGTTATRGDIRADPISVSVDYTVREQVAANQSGPVVQESDVQPLLAPALAGLNNRAREVLTTHAEQRGLVLEVTSIIPRTETLQAGQGYTLDVLPSVGQPVNEDTLTFSVGVAGSFSALATPPGQPLDEQLSTALLHHLARQNRLPPGVQVRVTNWRWDGTILSVDGVLSPAAGVPTLDAPTRATIRAAIRGESRTQAASALEQLQSTGVISGYTLPPDVEHLPDVDELLELQIVPAGAPGNGE